MSLIGQGMGAILAFVFTVLVGRLFHARGAGTFFEAVAVLTIAANISDLGADDGLNWMLPRLRNDGRVGDVGRILPIALFPVLLLSGILAVVIELSAGSLAHVFSHGHGSAHLFLFLRILAPFVPIAALVQVMISATRGFDRVWPLVTIWSLIVPAGRLMLFVVLWIFGVGLVAVAYSWAVPFVVGFGAAWWALDHLVRQERSRIGKGCEPEPRRTLARRFWVFSAPRAVASICSMALVWLDVLLVGWLISTRMAGIYAVANRYLVVVTFALAAIGGTIGPQVSRLLATNKGADLRRLYQTSTSWVMVTAWPCALGMAIYSPFLMRLFGREFAAGDTALSILAVMMLYVSATGSNVVVLVMSGSSSTSLWIGLATLAVNVGANLILIPQFGIDGAAVAWALSLFLSNVLINVVLYRRLDLHPFGPAFFVVAATALGCIGVVGTGLRLAFGPHLFALVLTIIIGGSTYLIILFRSRHRFELSRPSQWRPS